MSAPRELKNTPAATYRRELRAAQRLLHPKVVMCAVCGEPYKPKRAAKQPEKRCCSDVCKSRAYRERKRRKELTPNGDTDA